MALLQINEHTSCRFHTNWRRVIYPTLVTLKNCHRKDSKI